MPACSHRRRPRHEESTLGPEARQVRASAVGRSTVSAKIGWFAITSTTRAPVSARPAADTSAVDR